MNHLKTTSYDISLVPLCKAHLEQLAQTLRPADREELQATYGLPVRPALELCLQKSSIALAFIYQGKVCAAAGIEPESLLGERASLWSWTGCGVEKCPKTFWKVSRAALAYFQSLYPCLYAACAVRYRIARHYLRRLGACEAGKEFYLQDKKTKFQLYVLDGLSGPKNDEKGEKLWEEQ